MPEQALLEFTDRGIYCRPGNFYIDPWKPVEFAVITHAHSDHAYTGHGRYLAHHLSRQVLLHRLGPVSLQTTEYGETLIRNGVRISLFPAGHVPGSAQVKVEYRGETAVVSGDYKLEDDGVSTPFEPVRCHSFISECTFGMPVFQWRPQAELFADINCWWRRNQERGLSSVLVGYALGKAQRILQNIDLSIGNVFTHGAIELANEALRAGGLPLAPTTRVTPSTGRLELQKGLLLAPPSAFGNPWMRRFAPYELGYCSGWMAIRGAKRRRAADRGFVLSDHADWAGLISAIRATECERVYLTHGYTAVFGRYLRETGLDAQEVHTHYGNDEETGASAAPEAEDQVNRILPLGESGEEEQNRA